MTISVGEIRMMASNVVPQNCAVCDGRALAVVDYPDLYAAIGITYGISGGGYFNLPDLRGCVPINRSNTDHLGSTGGSEQVVLQTTQIPAHRHAMFGTSATATQSAPTFNLLAQTIRPKVAYTTTAPGAAYMSNQSIGNTGDQVGHDNVQPFLCVNFIIALTALGPTPPYLGEIRVFPFGFMPVGWAPCTGQLLQINQYTALYQLLGKTYGGDGQTTFGLPNLQGSVPMGTGDAPGRTPRSLGDNGGSAKVELMQVHLASHSHLLLTQPGGADAPYPQTCTFAQADGFTPYIAAAGATTQMYGTSIGNTGGSTPHNNLQPYMALNFGISLQGTYLPPAS